MLSCTSHCFTNSPQITGSLVAASSYMLSCTSHCFTNSLTPLLMLDSVSQTPSACRSTSCQILPTKGRLKQRGRQRHLTLQFQLQKSALFNLRICSCHQKPANVI